MSAGTGVRHSEQNASKSELVHFLQIWLLPSALGIAPSYEQKAFTEKEKRGRFCIVASPDGRDASVTVHSDVVVHAGLFDAGESAEVAFRAGRHAWVHVARGKVRVDGHDLKAGDGAAISNQTSLKVEGVEAGEVLLFDLP